MLRDAGIKVRRRVLPGSAFWQDWRSYPLSITEWSHGKPLADRRYDSTLFLAAISSLQAWDAPMLFGYSNRPLQQPGKAIPWSSWLDPPVMGLMPAAALRPTLPRLGRWIR